MNDSLHRRHPRGPPMKGQEGRLAPPRESDQEVVAAGEQDRDGHVDQAEHAGAVADVLAQLKALGQEPDVGLEALEGDGGENDVEDDVDADGEADGSAWDVAEAFRQGLEATGAEEGGEEEVL